MNQQIELSEAIRLGSMLKPQAFGLLYRPATDVRAPGDVLGLRRLPEATCALGAGFDAVGLPLLVDGIDFFEALARFQVLGIIVPHPVHGFPGHLMNIVMDLNDSYRWTREACADWVAGVEAKRDALLAKHAAAVAELARA